MGKSLIVMSNEVNHHWNKRCVLDFMIFDTGSPNVGWGCLNKRVPTIIRVRQTQTAKFYYLNCRIQFYLLSTSINGKAGKI